MEFNGDGKQDIVSGCYSEHQPMAGLFWLLAGKGDGTVAKAVSINGQNGKPLIIRAPQNEIVKSICTQPAAHDWDGDGDLDLLTGNFEGTYFFFRNDGSKEKAAFNENALPVLSSDKPLRLEGAHSGICAVDWDQDGDADIVTGSARGGAFLAENQGVHDGIPQFSAFRELLPPSTAGENLSAAPPAEATLPTAPGDNTRIWAADVNGDGKLDLLIGDSARLVARAPGISEKQFQKRETAWQTEMSELQAKLRKAETGGASEREALSQRLSALYARRAAFIKEDRTGFVWVAFGQ